MSYRVDGSRSSFSSTNENEVKPITKEKIAAQEQVLLTQTFEGEKNDWANTAGIVGGVASTVIGGGVALAAVTVAAAPLVIVAGVGAGLAVGSAVGYGIKTYVIDPYFSVTKTFAQIAEEYAAAQEGIRKKELGASDKALEASKILEGRVASLTSQDGVKDKETARARAKAAEKLIEDALKKHQFDGATRTEAGHRFLGRVGEEVVRKWVESIGLKVEGDIKKNVKKQAEVMHQLGYFSSVEEAKKAIKKEYAAYIVEHQDEANRIAKELAENPEVDDVAVGTRFNQEKAELNKLLEKRNKYCEQNPKKLAELQRDNEKEEEANEEVLRKQFPGIRLSAIERELPYYSGTLGDLAKQVRDQCYELAQNAAEIEQVKRKLIGSRDGRYISEIMRELQERCELDPSKVSSEERREVRQWVADKKRLEQLEEATLTIYSKRREIGKKFTAAEKEYKEIKAEIEKKEELLGNVEFPQFMNSRGVAQRIEEENKVWLSFLEERLQEGQAASSRGASEARMLEAELKDVLVASGAIRKCEQRRKDRGWDGPVTEALRKIPGLFEGLVQYVIDDEEGGKRLSSAADVVIGFLEPDFEDQKKCDAQQDICTRIKVELEMKTYKLEKAMQRIADREESVVLV